MNDLDHRSISLAPSLLFLCKKLHAVKHMNCRQVYKCIHLLNSGCGYCQNNFAFHKGTFLGHYNLVKAKRTYSGSPSSSVLEAKEILFPCHFIDFAHLAPNLVFGNVEDKEPTGDRKSHVIIKNKQRHNMSEGRGRHFTSLCK